MRLTLHSRYHYDCHGLHLLNMVAVVLPPPISFTAVNAAPHLHRPVDVVSTPSFTVVDAALRPPPPLPTWLWSPCYWTVVDVICGRSTIP
jgi:hypothetical protein